jgi:hypothetical protein
MPLGANDRLPCRNSALAFVNRVQDRHSRSFWGVGRELGLTLWKKRTAYGVSRPPDAVLAGPVQMPLNGG